MKNDNLHWIDYLRVFATFSVIFLHVATGILGQYGTISEFDWWVGNIYDSCVRFCVPVFLMISGALILSKTYDSIGEYVRKRVLRIVLPFLFWSTIYIAGNVFLKFHQGEHLTSTEILKLIVDNLKNGASIHLWYVYMIIGLYLFFPIIGKWINNSNKHEIKYFLGIWLITVFASLPFINEFIPNIEISYFSGYLGFPILGYYLNKTTFNFDRKKTVYLLSVLTGILITTVGTFFATEHKGSFDGGFYKYLSLNVILVSAGVFLFFKDFVKPRAKITPLVLFFSKYSYGIYLVHILVLWGLKIAGFSYAFVNPVIGIPVTSVLCFIISTLIIWSMNKVPLGKYISG